jgi:hypothetical protein
MPETSAVTAQVRIAPTATRMRLTPSPMRDLLVLDFRGARG